MPGAGQFPPSRPRKALCILHAASPMSCKSNRGPVGLARARPPFAQDSAKPFLRALPNLVERVLLVSITDSDSCGCASGRSHSCRNQRPAFSPREQLLKFHCRRSCDGVSRLSLSTRFPWSAVVLSYNRSHRARPVLTGDSHRPIVAFFWCPPPFGCKSVSARNGTTARLLNVGPCRPHSDYEACSAPTICLASSVDGWRCWPIAAANHLHAGQMSGVHSFGSWWNWVR